MKKDLPERVIKRYHFEKEDAGRIRELISDLERVVKLRIKYKEGNFQNGDVLAAVTLGEEADRLCEKLTDEGNLKDAYMAECILCEILTDAYDAFRESFFRDTGKYITDMRFIGDKDLLADHLSWALRMLDMEEIMCTSGGMMKPSKSVVFYAKVSAKKPEKCLSVCEKCGNPECGQREKYL